MYDAPSSRRPLPILGPVGEQRGPWMADVRPGDLQREPKPLRSAAIKALADHAEAIRTNNMASSSALPPPTPSSVRSAASSVMGPPPGHAAGGRLDRRRRPLAGAPWESLAVQQFAGKLYDSAALEAGKAPSAMVLKGPSGSTVLQAVGDPDDHRVAGRMVADMQEASGSTKNAGESQLQYISRGEQAPLQRTKVSFGAVYEHRDATGKPKIVASTGVLPERQFQLDYQAHSTVKDLSRQGAPGSSGHLVWVGIGSGPVGEQEMNRVREAVVDSRAERLRINKLSSEKPYSRHF